MDKYKISKGICILWNMFINAGYRVDSGVLDNKETLIIIFPETDDGDTTAEQTILPSLARIQQTVPELHNIEVWFRWGSLIIEKPYEASA